MQYRVNCLLWCLYGGLLLPDQSPYRLAWPSGKKPARFTKLASGRFLEDFDTWTPVCNIDYLRQCSICFNLLDKLTLKTSPKRCAPTSSNSPFPYFLKEVWKEPGAISHLVSDTVLLALARRTNALWMNPRHPILELMIPGHGYVLA